MSKINDIAVIGAGLMGHGIAQIFAANGYQVSLFDLEEPILSKALEGIRSNLTLMAGKGIGHTDDIEQILSRIRTTVDLQDAVAGVQFVVEAVIEDLGVKQQLFQKIDGLCPPESILTTNTSVISITEIAQNAQNRERILGTHFWNPPYLVPLVEVVRGQDTADKTMDTTYELLKSVGKHPVRVKKDVPGFVGNRLQHALWREAISIVEKGIADPAMVDECVKFGFGLRLPVLGPLENADMVGLDLTLAIHDYILKHLEDSPESSELLRQKVEKSELGFKTGKGFQEWPEKRADDLRKNLLNYLLEVTKTSS
jgi:3-hydroxybutyryl-CoA dehydrogenase